MTKNFVCTSIIITLLLTLCFNITASSAAERVRKIRLKGAINKSAPSSVTIATLSKLTVTDFSVFNPYKKARFTYQGVLMKELIKVYGKPGVNKIKIDAIDGYSSSFEKEEWQKWDIMFAYKANGKLFKAENNGPLKVVMPYDTSPDMDPIYFEPKWIWAIKKITFIE